jgi:hypothetical protein
MVRTAFIVIVILSGFSWGCESGNSTSKSNLPNAKGEPAEVILVMDSAMWHGPVGEEVRLTFAAPVPGLLQPEPLFALKYVDPLRLGDILRQAKNMIFVTVLSSKSQSSLRLRSYFTEESLQRIQEDPKLFSFTKKDEFAQNQIVLHLFGRNQEELIENIRQNRNQLQQQLIRVEINRVSEKLYNAASERKLATELQNEHQFYLNIPYGYELAVNEPGFVWLRMLDPAIEKNIFIRYLDYTSENMFRVSRIIDLRDQIGQQYIYDIENKDVFMETETLIPLDTNQIVLSNKFAVSYRGMWKLNKATLGGPFIGYATVDESGGRFYYVEGYIVSPGKKKRDNVREMMAILNTFKAEGNYITTQNKP